MKRYLFLYIVLWIAFLSACTYLPDQTTKDGQVVSWEGVKIETFYLLPYSGEKERLVTFLGRNDISVLSVEKTYRTQMVMQAYEVIVYYKSK